MSKSAHTYRLILGCPTDAAKALETLLSEASGRSWSGALVDPGGDQPTGRALCSAQLPPVEALRLVEALEAAPPELGARWARGLAWGSDDEAEGVVLDKGQPAPRRAERARRTLERALEEWGEPTAPLPRKPR